MDKVSHRSTSEGRTELRDQFCAHLRESREAKDMSLDDIARVTRIPQLSLTMLENGEFERLPADVFVRGFLTAFADCVGLDVDDTLQRYTACGLEPAPVAVPNAGDIVGGGDSSRRRTATKRARHTTAGHKTARHTTARPAASQRHRQPPAPLPALNQEAGGKRSGLTLAVIILVIVATLTMSYLLREPSSTGDGVTEVTESPGSLLRG